MPTRVNALAVMAKAPIAGIAKTRLVPPLTHAQAADVSRALLVDQLEHLKNLTAADLYVVFTPAHATAVMRDIIPPEFRCFSQRGEGLGARMSDIFDELMANRYQNVVLIGSDLPALPLSHLEQAFGILQSRRGCVVLGPSRDGGYYLLGMNRRTPQIFQGMTWSHDQVLARTLATLAALAIDSELLPSWFDIDTIDDLRRLNSCLDCDAKKTLKNTFKLLSRLELKGGPEH